VKFHCDPVLRQVAGIAQTISELRRFLFGPPEERASIVGKVIADYDPTQFADAPTALQMQGSHHCISDRWIWKTEGYLDILKRV
jgi:hypothetical protein